MKVLIQGAGLISDVPGIESIADKVDLAFAPDEESMERELPSSKILLGWNFRGQDLSQHWNQAADLRWIHWCGAGVDALLFEELRKSDVVVTNARGIFDRAMAEYVLGYMLAEAKDFRTNWRNQIEHSWNYRINQKLQGDRVLIFGVGSIGREIARLLKAIGLQVSGVGRTARSHDPDFDRVYASSNIGAAIFESNWIIGVLPSTPSTERCFDAKFFNSMNCSARFLNIGRGSAVVESDLFNALTQNIIAGAMLDVFSIEPLKEDDPLWETPNLFISPHISGDYHGYSDDIVSLFKDNLEKYLCGKVLRNVVDKNLGFVATHSTEK